MKRKVMLLTLVSVLGLTGLPVMAEVEPVEPVGEAVVEEAAEDAADDMEIMDVEITVGGEVFTIKNDTGLAFKNVEYREEVKEADESDAEASEADTDAQDAEAATVWNLILTDENDMVHTLTDVAPDVNTWKEATLVNQFGFLYLQYKDANGADQDIAEEAEEKELDQETPVYVLTGLNLRETASTDAPVLTVLSLGNELTAVAAAPGWVKVKKDDKTGYVAYRYITTDKATVDQLLEEQAARAAAAAQAAAAASSSSSSYSEPDYSTPTYTEPAVTEPTTSSNGIVSIESYDDCDGSGHGYREITYEDGSTEIEEY